MTAVPPDPTALSPGHRERSLRRMSAEVFDILVVGGGVTGTGAALDAASRGLSVALIEARDYAAGASSKSSKLIHGGLRYLEMLDFGLVREALRERRLLLTELAPHLVRPVPFLWPLTHRGWERPYVGAGLLLYDSLGGRRAVPRARHLSRAQALRLAPALRPDALTGAVQFYDAQEDDARMLDRGITMCTPLDGRTRSSPPAPSPAALSRLVQAPVASTTCRAPMVRSAPVSRSRAVTPVTRPACVRSPSIRTLVASAAPWPAAVRARQATIRASSSWAS